MTERHRICGIDPGLATGGMVLLATGPEEVLDAVSLGKRTRRKPQAGSFRDEQFTDAVLRARANADTVRETLTRWQPDEVVVESYVHLHSRDRKRNQRGARMKENKAWATPLGIGMIDAVIVELGYAERARYQNPAALSGFYQDSTIARLEARNDAKTGEDVLCPGDRLLTSKHLIVTYCHAAWAADRPLTALAAA